MNRILLIVLSVFLLFTVVNAIAQDESFTKPLYEKTCPPNQGKISSPQTVFGFDAQGIVADSGFEAGTPNAFWNEFSSNFGTPLCDANCGTGGGTGPHTGSWWAWFGGINASETGSVDQDLTIPTGVATLSFWLEIPVANNTGFMQVLIDGDTLFSVTNNDSANYQPYSQVAFDISAYADGGVHNLMFFSMTDPGSGVTNFFVDDVSIEVAGSPDNPNPPSNVSAYSDFNTPNSMMLTWTDPTTLVGGDPITPFTIEIDRDGSNIASVASGTETYTDMGLTDGQLYSYDVYTKLISNDSTSSMVNVSWHAGGDPVPAAPDNLQATGGLTDAVLTWNDPTTQADGTPLDDLDHINIYRDGAMIATAAPGDETYTDTPPSSGFYSYTVTAVDNETPPNESAPSNEGGTFVGANPDYLVWVHPDVAAGTASAASGDSIFAAIVANGGSAYLTNNLFEFGTDLSIFQGVFVVLGIFSNNGVLGAASPEASALDTYVTGGGNLYIEGGDCFYYDPQFASGYDINPWFDCVPLADGTGDVFDLLGLNELSAFTFTYGGENNWMDQLSSGGLSSEIWQESTTSNIHGLYYDGFGGAAIGVVPSFGGMMSSASSMVNSQKRTYDRPANQESEAGSFKVRPGQVASKPFLKKGGYKPELASRIDHSQPLYKITPNGIEILANTQVDLMAAYLDLMQACTPGFLGDINGDDLVNSTDALVALSYDAGLPLPQAFLDRIAIGFGDVNDDGATNSTDGLVMLSYDSGIPTPFPVGDPVCLPDNSKREANTSKIVPENSRNVMVSAAPAIKQIAPGSTFEVPVMIDVSKTSELLGSYTATLEWNPNVFEFVGYSGGTVEGFGNPVVNDRAVEEGRLTFAHAYPYGAQGQVNILNVRMKSISDAEAEGSISLSFSAMAAAKTFKDLLPYVVNSDAEVSVGEIAYGLSNYPNPFNPSTDIRYGLAEAGNVEIVIYNVLGQKVLTLVDGRKEAGNYMVRWHGRNDNGQSLPSGMYFLRMEAGKFRADRKLLFLK